MPRKRALSAADAKRMEDLRVLFAKGARLAHERRVMQAVLEAPSPLAADNRATDARGATTLPDLALLDLNDAPVADTDEGEMEPDAHVSLGTDVAGPSTETVEERRARTLREWDALKVEIMGTPATWGINPQTKKPRKRRPDRTPAELQAARNQYAAHKHEMKSEHPHDHKTQFVMSSRTSWCSTNAFLTLLPCIPDRLKTMSILSYTWADACRADAAAVACSDAHERSLKAQRAKKKEHFAANAARREFGLCMSGDCNALERRELLRLRDHVHTVTGRRMRVLLCPDGCWADTLFRTEAMPAGQWLAWQHKSTAKMVTDKRGMTCWVFQNVLGYRGALVVCSVEDEPNRLWVLHGTVLDDHGVRNMTVTKSKETKGILPVPADGKTLPTNLEGLVAALERECAKVVDGDDDALPTCTVEEADAMLSQSHAVEREGILAWMRCVHGGEQVPWLQMPEAMRDDDRNLRLLRDGTVVAYPEGQNTKVDLEVLHDWRDLQGRKTKHQFKTPGTFEGESGLWVSLLTRAGKDAAGTQLLSNTYKEGDNDVYVAVLPDKTSKQARKGHVDIWEIPEAKLLELGLLGTADAPPAADVGGFRLHPASNRTRKSKHKWTCDYHSCYVNTHHGWLPGSVVGEALAQAGLLLADSDTGE